MNISQPLASSIGSVDFAVLTKEEIKTLSVKEITSKETYSKLLHPEPGGLCDPALGSRGDDICGTCHQRSWHCPGHAGHIELPVVVYHPIFLPQLLHLLNAKCGYCHRLKVNRAKLEVAKCKLVLLEHGLIEEAEALDDITLNSERTKLEKLNAGSEEQEDGNIESDGDAEDQADELMRLQRTYVRTSVRQYKVNRIPEEKDATKSETTSALRRQVIGHLLADSRQGRKCASCQGLNPRWRKIGLSKIFRKPLSAADKKRMTHKSRKILNPLVTATKARKRSLEKRREERDLDEAIDIGSDDLISLEEDGEDIDTAHESSENELSPKRNPVVTAKSSKSSTKDREEYVTPQEIRAAIAELFREEQEVFQLIYNRGLKEAAKPLDPDIFFIDCLLVPPNRFRPDTKTANGSIAEAFDTTLYKRVLEANYAFSERQKMAKRLGSQPEDTAIAFRGLQEAGARLQDNVNAIFDSNHGPRQNRALQQMQGIKQKLEKKEGLFRMNMMGKRVNFAARSVISPDPNIETNEIGVPPVFARKLTFPEPVTNHNYAELKEAVLNGVSKWPGATAIENESGQVINLRFKTSDERMALANLLLQPSNTNANGSTSKKVHRHLVNGDIVLMNRQPTLHKPSIMAHKARILPGEKTIRMHYANCNTYNADFDGDEMNLHFPQNELARAEALHIADTDHQYLVATSGKPLRGLIQDHISMGVWLTSRDTFFSRENYHQLLCSCLRPEKDQTTTHKIETVEPAIIHPQKRWTGKQVITTVLKNIRPRAHAPLQLQGRSQTPGDSWKEPLEGEVIVKDGELLSGILDKAHLGPTTGGLVHAVYEVYGHVAAGQLLSILGRLLTRFLHMRAFTCGIDDLRLTPEGEAKRSAKMRSSTGTGQQIAAKYVTLDERTPDNDRELQKRLRDVYKDQVKLTGLDNVYNAQNAALSSEITAECLPSCLVKPFPWNQMQMMTTSGAKGSSVNANFISCNLGQQVLEGRRVPVMVSGRTLPSFKPFDTSIRSGGYITNRFLTGIRPQEYFFHAMAGREGLVDTAVKTATSGYLQRCLIKGMEGLRSEYDASVRDSDGSVVQFVYGEDGLDVTKQKHLTDFHFQLENYLSLVESLNLRAEFNKLKDRGALEHNKVAMRKYAKTGQLDCMDPALAIYNPSSNAGSTSESFAMALKAYSDVNPDNMLVDKRKSKVTGSALKKRTFASLMNAKYLKSTIEPGEAVGVVAGQSIGEPSTQMTLNTFHLAGHAAKNVTMGIPRLREIVMRASKAISTPAMTLYLIPELTETTAEKFAKGITKLTLAEVMDNVSIHERIGKGVSYEVAKLYTVRLNLFPAPEYCETYAIRVADVLKTLESDFVPLLCKDVKREIRRKNNAKVLGDVSAQPRIGESSGRVEEYRGNKEAGMEGGQDGEDVEADDAEDTDEKHNRKEVTTYDESDDESDDDEKTAGQDQVRHKSPDAETDVDSAIGGSPRPAQSDDGSQTDSEEDDEAAAVEAVAKEREGRIKDRSPAVTRFAFDDTHAEWCEIQLEYDNNTPKLLLLPLVESACRNAVIQSIPHLGACTFTKQKEKSPESGQLEDVSVVLTQGVNLHAMHEYQDILNPHRIFTNDIWAVMQVYGVEAGRATIIREMDSIFKGHNIVVDMRHLNLIADFMTRSGGFLPFNRYGMVDGVSPFQKASFETTTQFLRDAARDRDWDDLKNPSASLVVGKLTGVGTGCFDVLNPVAARINS